jgi:molybdate transport system substrate-binding protein
LRQDAALLSLGKDNAAALALIKYMRTDRAKTIIRTYGYTL